MPAVEDVKTTVSEDDPTSCSTIESNPQRQLKDIVDDLFIGQEEFFQFFQGANRCPAFGDDDRGGRGRNLCSVLDRGPGRETQRQRADKRITGPCGLRV